MFSKNDKPAEITTNDSAPATTNLKPSGSPSVISSDLKIIGNLESIGDVLIEGTIEGDVKSRSLTVGEGAHVKGSISADKVTISGAITGQVRAETVNIAKTAKIMGDIIHQNLSIEAGAYLEGRFSRNELDKPNSKDTAVEPKIAVVATATKPGVANGDATQSGPAVAAANA